MSRRKNIFKWTRGYWCLQNLIVGPIFRFNYKKLQLHNTNNVPKNESVILAPNHQNALMDALTFVGGTSFQVLFLARADIFKKNLVAKFLTYIKILPVYRSRDGRSELSKNDQIFEITEDALRNKVSPMCLFPEGNHGGKRRLRPLVKGIFRIAFRAQEESKDKPAVKIVPVGIDYSHYQKFRQTLFINFGEAIEVSEYWSDFEETPSVAINALRDRLASEMKKVMINIETEDYYDLYMTLRILYRKKMCRELGLKNGDLADNFVADKMLIARLDRCLETEPQQIEKLNKLFQKYSFLKEKLNYRDWVPVRKKYSIIANLIAMIVSVVTLPLALLGFLNNWPHFFIPQRFVTKIKDAQFHSTIKWGSGMFMLLVYYLILFILALIFLPFWWLKLIYILTLPSSGIFAVSYRKFIVKSWARIRYSFPFGKRAKSNREFKENYDLVIKLTSEISEKYKLAD